VGLKLLHAVRLDNDHRLSAEPLVGLKHHDLTSAHMHRLSAEPLVGLKLLVSQRGDDFVFVFQPNPSWV